MKILAIGDPHGKIPKIGTILKREKPDLIICTGDFADDEKIRSLIFKNWGKPWYWKIGKKKAGELVRKSEKKGREVLRFLKKLKIPVYIIPGNYDGGDSFRKMGKKLHFCQNKKFRIGDYYLVFHGGYMDAKIFFATNVLSEGISEMKMRKKRNDTEKKKLIKILGKTNGKIILVTHIPAYGLFDKVRNKESPMNNRHIGIEAYEYIIKKYKPRLYICGHMHENQGIKKIGKTTAICLGEAAKYVYLVNINHNINISRIKLK